MWQEGEVNPKMEAGRKEEVWAERVLQAARDAVVMADEEGRILWVNPAAESMFGYGHRELVGRWIQILMPERYKEIHQRMMKEYTLQGKAPEFRRRTHVEGIRADQTEFPLEIVLSGFWVDKKCVFIAFMNDRSEEAMAAAVIEKAYRDLKEAQAHLLQSEKMASIGQLAAGMAHEINNPIGFVRSNLQSLSGYAEELGLLLEGFESFLKTASQDDPRAAVEEAKRLHDLMGRIDVRFILDDLSKLSAESIEGIERVSQIVQDLRDFSNIDRGEQVWFELNQGIESALTVVWNEIKQKAEVVKALGKIPEIFCYPQELNQVFMHLLVNAAQAIEEKGTISIRSFALDGQVVVEVEDTGSGIPPEHLKRIFDPFFTTRPVGKGKGLGLSIAYRIVQKHQGKIEVESALGKGTKFSILLPINIHQRIPEDQTVFL